MVKSSAGDALLDTEVDRLVQKWTGLYSHAATKLFTFYKDMVREPGDVAVTSSMVG